MNKYKLCKHRANLGIKIHFITTLTQSNKEDMEIYNTDRKDNIMFSFISFRRNINYLLPRLLNFWKPDTLPRITNCYDVHAYMPQHQYLAFFVYIITVYTSLYYILKHKISKRNNIYVCDGKHRPEHFLFIHKTKFHNKKCTASQHPSFQM